MLFKELIQYYVFQALNYLRMSSRIDAVSQRVQTAVTMKQVMFMKINHALLCALDIFCSFHWGGATLEIKFVV